MLLRSNTLLEKQATLRNWVVQFGDDLFTWAYHKTRNQPIAEDMVQDTFLAAFQAFDSFHNQSSPRTWLFSILRNKIIDHYRQQAKHITSTLEEQNDQTDSLFDEDGNWHKDSRPREWDLTKQHLLDDLEFSKVFSLCLEELPTNWSACLRLKYLDGKEGKEICQVLNITTSNFWQIIHRAKLQVRVCLEKRWFNL